MILFVFEGAEREPRIFKTLERLFFGEGERIIRSFGNSIYELYRQLKDLDGEGDIVSILRENKANEKDSPFPKDVRSSDFSEIYLFFDKQVIINKEPQIYGICQIIRLRPSPTGDNGSVGRQTEGVFSGGSQEGVRSYALHRESLKWTLWLGDR